MNEVSKVLETTYHKESRPFLITALLSFLLNVGIHIAMFSTLQSIEYTGNGVPFGFAFDCIMLLSFLIYIILHVKRWNRCSSSGRTRISLLPIHPTAYLYAEMLFLAGTLCVQLLSFACSFLCIYGIYAIRFPLTEHSLLFSLLAYSGSNLFMPIGMERALVTVLGILTVVLVLTLLSIALFSEKLFQQCLMAGLLLLIPGFLGMIYLFSELTSGLGSLTYTQNRIWLVSGMFILCDVCILWMLRRAYANGKVAG